MKLPRDSATEDFTSKSDSKGLKLAIICSVVVLFFFTCIEAHRVSTDHVLRVGAVGAISFLSYFVVSRFVSSTQTLFVKGNLFGKDINKRGTAAGEIVIPESLGLISATIYIIILCVLHILGHHNGSTDVYTIAMACVTFMTLLGFADDVLDLKWRYKLVLPLFASLPLLVNYKGHTTVNIPRFLHPLISRLVQLVGVHQTSECSAGTLVNLGYGYYIYMAMLSIFCTNAINIYAGINGLEAGQVAVIAIFVIVHNTLNLNPALPKDNIDLLRHHHSFSLDMIIPLLAVTLGLLQHNWYPSRVFVGDTFCYFSGMSFAMASILGHYSLTLLLFFVPQIINFLYSFPQLIGIVPCPRHRLPKFDKDTGKLSAVKEHRNLVNLTLWLCGPMSERQLCTVLLILQAVCCCIGLIARDAYLKYFT